MMHYSKVAQETVEERQKSNIYKLRHLNNQVVDSIVQEWCAPHARVLDLACGNGGALFKFVRVRADHYIGVDCDAGRVAECKRRLGSCRFATSQVALMDLNKSQAWEDLQD